MHQDLLNLQGIDEDRYGRAADRDVHGDSLLAVSAGVLGRGLDHGAEVRLDCGQLALLGHAQELLDDVGRAAALLVDLLEFRAGRFVGHESAHGRREEGDAREGRIELVSDEACEVAHRGESFGLDESTLQGFLFRDVPDDDDHLVRHQRKNPSFELLRPRGYFEAVLHGRESLGFEDPLREPRNRFAHIGREDVLNPAPEERLRGRVQIPRSAGVIPEDRAVGGQTETEIGHRPEDRLKLRPRTKQILLGPLSVDRHGNLLRNEVEDRLVLLRESYTRRVTLDDDDADRLSVAHQGCADPVDGGRADGDDLSAANKRVKDLRRGEECLPGREAVFREAATELLSRWRALLLINEVRELERPGFVIREGDVEVRGGHEAADHLLYLSIHLRGTFWGVRRLRNAIDCGWGCPGLPRPCDVP